MRIFLDPGHGGSNPGAIGANGLEEADVNLDVALKTGRLLQAEGYTVNYSRLGDETVSLSEIPFIREHQLIFTERAQLPKILR